MVHGQKGNTKSKLLLKNMFKNYFLNIDYKKAPKLGASFILYRFDIVSLWKLTETNW